MELRRASLPLAPITALKLQRGLDFVSATCSSLRSRGPAVVPLTLQRRTNSFEYELKDLGFTVVDILEFLEACELGASTRTVCRWLQKLSEGAARNRVRAIHPDDSTCMNPSKAFAGFPISWQRDLWECERLVRRRMSKRRFTMFSALERSCRTQHLCEACKRGNLALVTVILELGADVDAQGACIYEDDVWTDSPLGHTVAGAGLSQLEVAKKLVRHGAEVDNIAEYGSTPLHNAAQQGNLDLVKFLVLVGSDVNLRGARGQTALDWTRGEHHPNYDGAEAGRAAVAAFLRARGAMHGGTVENEEDEDEELEDGLDGE